MANYLNLRDIKKHLNIDSYYTDDDIYLEALMNVAEKVVEKHIDIGLAILADYNGGELPPPLIHAMLLFVGNMYANRESVAFASSSEIPLSYQYILDLYKCYNPSNYSMAMNVIDNLISFSTTDALSANQGRILKELIDSINVEVDLTNYYTKQQTDALMTTKADVTHTHVIGQVADLQAELDAKANVSDLPDVSQLMTETTADNKYQPKGEYLTAIPEEYVTDTELSAKNYATQAWVNEQGYLTQHQDITGLATKEELNRKQDTLVSGINIKTINGASILGNGNISIESPEGGITDAPKDGNQYARKDGSWEKVTIPDTSNLLTRTEASNTYQPKGDYLTSVPAEYVTETELTAKGYATTTQLEAKLDVETYNNDKATFATKDEIPTDYVTTETAEATYAKKTEIPDTSDFVTTVQLNGKQDTLISGNNIKTINGASILGEGDITIESPEGGIIDAPNDGKLYGRKSTQWSEVVIPDTSNLATKTELGQKLDTSTYNEEKATFALKTEIPDISNLATETELTEGLAGKVDLTVYNAKIAELEAMIGQISTKLDEINGETIE